MLSEAKIFECLQSADCTGVVRMSFESGPYCIDRPTIKASRFAEQIESAACAERDARIAELERELEEARKDAERLDWLEQFINEHGAIHLHDGENPSGIGLGLRPGLLNRRLREAIDAAIKEQT